MFPSLLLLPLAAVLQQSVGQYAGIATDLPEKIQEEILDKFNAIRRGVQPTASNMMKMKWSHKLANNAKEWAQQCIAKAPPKADRTIDGVLCGDNRVRATYSSSWSEVIDLWNRKSSNFKYGTGAVDPTKDVYGYTQMIWHNSYLIGCTLAYCPAEEYKFLYVCRFCPAGNRVDQIATPYKEGPPCGDCPNDCEDKLCIRACEYADMREDCTAIVTYFTCQRKEIQDLCPGTCKCPQGAV
ncbi:cysteine-rich venom protein piscivorin-like [Sceloporus undulatus]|uniref:cysteine-rich venom protein piscivorin-like n=1 Tax=Sceloporus undulatus TaxID=8520 RepID=UPI001C4CD6D1|nr:cysteine-rich venom protein piscivorin-like [Sceloporus undulatus]